jgi:hypothetical protein
LPGQVIRWAGNKLGYDFSKVRIHADATAASLTRQLGATALTIGRDIFFAQGAYQPQTAPGRRLIAHELAHVVQQATGATVAYSPARRSQLEAQADGQAQAFVMQPHTRPRPLPAPPHTVLQRYTVPGALPCNEVVDWLNSSSPYAPEWAQTQCHYAFNGGISPSLRTLSDGTYEARVRGHGKLSVTVACPIDRPSWNPTPRPNRAAEVTAWNTMSTALNGHEQQHRQIGQQWRATLQSNYRGVDFTVTGVTQADAMQAATAQLSGEQQQWMADAQAAQSAIDPFTGAVLTCP